MKNHLSAIEMSNADYNQFSIYKNNVKNEIAELSAFLNTLEAKNKERIWLRNLTSGELDDAKLVDGIIGERTIYKIRSDDHNSMFFQKPKRIFFVFDLSARYLEC
jgi:hypothetical protein